MRASQRGILGTVVVAMVIGGTVGVVRKGRLVGRAEGGDLPPGCGGPAIEERTGTTAQAITTSNGKLFAWNACYGANVPEMDVGPYGSICVEQWGSYASACYSNKLNAYFRFKDDTNTKMPGTGCKGLCQTTTCPYGCFTAYDSGTAVLAVASVFTCEVARPSVTTPVATLTSTSLTVSYTFSQAYGGSNDSDVVWYRASDGYGTNSVTMTDNMSTTTKTTGTNTVVHTIGASDLGKYAKFCVTPKTIQVATEDYCTSIQTSAVTTCTPTTVTKTGTGTQQCTGWISMDIPSASGVTVAYDADWVYPSYTYKDPLGKAESGTTYSWTWRFADMPNATYTVGTSKSWNVSLLTKSGPEVQLRACVTPKNGTNAGSQVCSDWTYLGAASASAVSAKLSGGVATASYVFSEGNSASKRLSDGYQWQRCSTTDGANATNISSATSSTYTLTANDRGYYLRACVTPTDFNNGTATQVCSSTIYIGPSASKVYTIRNGGTWLGYYTFSDSYPGASESGSTFQWYGGSTTDGTSVTAISGATSTSMSTTLATGYSYVYFCVTPSDGTSTGLMQCSKPLATAWTPTISGTAQTGNTLTLSYGFTCGTTSNDLESGSTYQWYTVDSSGTATAITGATSTTFTSTASEAGSLVKACVTPKCIDGTTGTTACSDPVTILPTISWWSNDRYSGDTATKTITYGECVAMSSLNMDLAASSVKVYGVGTGIAYLRYYTDGGCTNSSPYGTLSITKGTMGSIAQLSSVGYNDTIRSYKVYWVPTPTASDVAMSFAGNIVTGTYSSTGDNSATTLAFQRADDSTGTNSTTISTTATYTVTAYDNNYYMRFCVTPADEYSTGTQVCTSWTFVGPLLQVWADAGYSGNNVNIPWMKASDCITLENYLGSTGAAFTGLTAFRFVGYGSGPSTLWTYTGAACTGTSGTWTAGTPQSEYDISNVGAGWNDKILSVKVTYMNTSTTWWKFTVKSSGYCLDVLNNDTRDETGLQQWACNGTSAQAWKLGTTSDGYTTLIGQNSGSCMDIRYASTSDNAVAQIYKCNNTFAQRFIIYTDNSGYWYLKNQYSGKCLGILSGTNNVVQATCNGLDSQKWTITGL